MRIVVLSQDCAPTRFFLSHLDPNHDYTVVLESGNELSVLKSRFKRSIRNHGLFKGMLHFLAFVLELPWILWETRKFSSALKERFSDSAFPPEVRIERVETVNSPKLIQIVGSADPHLIIVYGTGIIRKHIIKQIWERNIPMLNWHCGITPEYRGVKSELYCLVNNEPEMIGSTIHHIAAGIDTGKVVMQKKLPIETYSEKERYNLAFLREKNIESSVAMFNDLFLAFQDGELPSLSTEGRASRLYRTPRLRIYLQFRKLLR